MIILLYLAFPGAKQVTYMSEQQALLSEDLRARQYWKCF